MSGNEKVSQIQINLALKTKAQQSRKELGGGGG